MQSAPRGEDDQLQATPPAPPQPPLHHHHRGSSLPTTMRAAIYNSYGPIDAVQYVENHPLPQYGANDVLIRVHSAAINPVDWKIMNGKLSIVTGSSFPKIPGFDFSGEIAAVGANVRKWKIGDEVYGMAHFRRFGTCAEYFATHEDMLAYKPKNLSHDEAAGLPLVGLTVWQGLIDEGTLMPGKSVLILGGSGGTGSMAIQLAKRHLSARRVITTCSGRNADFVKSLGADEVIDYTTTKWYEQLKGQQLDLVLDCVGGEENSYSKAESVLKSGSQGGAYVTIAPGDQNKGFGFEGVWSLAKSWVGGKFGQLTGGPRLHMVSCAVKQDQLAAIAILAEKKMLQPMVSQENTYQLKQTKEALKQNEEGRTRGKIIVRVIKNEEEEPPVLNPPQEDFQL
eukprot:TRINITY_DN2325_c0_g1_i3.p2 TRINITY_DN2325_c0_g1~~TRINITY_DN2325_c0_g1_i3.p2  ORF type:complete len:396 (-),score=118.28 TRINITY_DN2325_c0_g1_i3:2333-3520(-)